MLAIVTGLCVAGFAAGLGVAAVFRADPGRRASLMFGLGMTNNGTGLVLATTALANVPDVMLPVIFVNLVQHAVAAVFHRRVIGGGALPKIKSPLSSRSAQTVQAPPADNRRGGPFRRVNESAPDQEAAVTQ